MIKRAEDLLADLLGPVSLRKNPHLDHGKAQADSQEPQRSWLGSR